ncbi:DUF5752 family protein [Candidatus Altiarchaeota archaeon]
MKAVLLAGGFGTRMRPLTFSKPKPLLPLVNKPVLLHILEHLNRHGVDEVFLTTNYLRDQIIKQVGFEYNGLKINYPVEEQPRGTAGCVKNITEGLDETFLVVQGDTITDIDLTQLVKQHRYYSGLATIAGYTVEDPWNYGVMELQDDGQVRHFREKPVLEECMSNLANTGIYVLEPEVLEHIPCDTFYDFAKDLFPVLLERGSIYASRFDGFWVDVGQPGGYLKARNWIMDGLKTSIAPSVQIDGRVEGNIIIGENTIIENGVELKGPIILGSDIVIKKGSRIGPYTSFEDDVYLGKGSALQGAIIFSNTSIGSKANITDSFIAENCVLGTNDSLQSEVLIGPGCSLGGNISVSEGSKIWPNIHVVDNSMISGTLRSFIPPKIIHYDARWSLRTVSPDEAFYFNKSDAGYIQYTGLRARSLWEFNDILKHVDARSMHYHLRSELNDFSVWLSKVISDDELAKSFNNIKAELTVNHIDVKNVRKLMVEASRNRIADLIENVRPSGYL